MSLLIYGANGYTGELCARRAAAEGLPAVLAGRRADVVGALAAELGRPHLAFALDRPAAVDAALTGITVVLNCAGPFSRTAAQLVGACLRAKAHYLDITGELAVLEGPRRRDHPPARRGVRRGPVRLPRRARQAPLALGHPSDPRLSGGRAHVARDSHDGHRECRRWRHGSS
jgi:short subunit dehydrogenase-like uncharacterized protein